MNTITGSAVWGAVTLVAIRMPLQWRKLTRQTNKRINETAQSAQ